MPLSTFTGGLQNGGSAGLVYGYIFVWAGSMLQALVMSELASMFVESCNVLLLYRLIVLQDSHRWWPVQLV